MPFYTRISPDPALARGYLHLLEAIAFYTAKKRFADAAQARAVLAEMFREYEALSVRGAAKADAYIRDRIRQTQVRPDASGRLRDSVKSRPLPSRLPAGSIGIADIEVLDAGTINPTAPTKGSYWRAQEHGTSAHVGRIVPGYFTHQAGSGQGSAPSAGEFRVHPYFDPVYRTRGTPAMVIGRPLKARHFLRDGADNTAVWHAAQSGRIIGEAVSRLARL